MDSGTDESGGDVVEIKEKGRKKAKKSKYKKRKKKKRKKSEESSEQGPISIEKCWLEKQLAL